MTSRLIATAVLLLTLLAGADAHASGSQRIAGGYTPHPSQWPWATALVVKGTTDSFCTGTLIDARRVLTAAHCVAGAYPKTAGDMQVLVGRKTLADESEGERRDVTSFVVHPKASLPTTGTHTNHAFYDVAILFLDEPSTLTPAPLGTEDSWGSGATAMGFGHTNYDHDNPAEATAIRAADLDLWTDRQCSEAIDSASAQHYFSAIHVCAGDADLRDCITHGDSGGPLMVRTDGVWELVGVTSFYPVGGQYECGVIGFAWVAGPTLREWILTVTEPAPDVSISLGQVDRYIPTVIRQNAAGRVRALRRSCTQAGMAEMSCALTWRIGRSVYRARGRFFHTLEGAQVFWNYSLSGKRRTGRRVAGFHWGV